MWTNFTNGTDVLLIRLRIRATEIEPDLNPILKMGQLRAWLYGTVLQDFFCRFLILKNLQTPNSWCRSFANIEHLIFL